MSTPQDQIKSAVKSAEATVVGDITKIKAWYADHRVYIAASLRLITGFLLRHVW